MLHKTGGLLAALILVGCSTTGPRSAGNGYKLSTFVPGSAMHGVHGLAFAADGMLYGASLTGYSIYQIDPVSGEVTTKVGPPLGSSDDVAVAPDGTIAWTAAAFSAIHALTPEGEIKVLAKDLPAVNSINYASNGRLFVTRVFGGDALYEIDPNGEKDPRLIAKKLGGLNGFEVTDDMQLYGPQFLKGNIIKVDVESGEVEQVADNFIVPAAVNFDSQGRLYVVDFDDGTLTRLTLEDGGREIIAQLEPPLDNLAISADDQIFVSNPATNTITEIDPETGATRVVTSGQLSGPGGIATATVAGEAVLLVADFWGNRYFTAANGNRTMLPIPDGVTASASIAANDQYYAFASIWPFGLVYVIDREANKVVKTAKFSAPYSPVFMDDGSLLVADYTAGTVTRLAAGKSRDKEEVVSGLAGPVGLVAAGETFFVSEFDAGRIRKIAADGSSSVLLSGLDRPEGLAMGRDGLLLVAEAGSGRLLSLNPVSGETELVADQLAIGLQGGADLPAPFLPTGVAVDSDNSIYVSADIDNAIYKITRQ